jgi:cysteine-rich repeat protein
LIVCGDGEVAGTEQCDDAGVSGGCDATCNVEMGWLCVTNATGQSVCFLDTTIQVNLAETVVDSATCNVITFSFALVGLENYLTYDFSQITYLPFEYTLFLSSYWITGTTIHFRYNYASNIEGKDIIFLFVLSSISTSLPDKTVTVTVKADNNVFAYVYPSSDCEERASVQKMVEYVEYASFGTLFLSAIPCKIVGLELFGVLQLAFFALGSLDGINLMLMPLLALKDSNGYAFSSIVSTGEVPTRINGIDYDSSFLNNCNLMMAVLLAEILLAIAFFVLSNVIVTVSSTLSRLAIRFIK